MSALRSLAREVAHNMSYRKTRTTDMFDYFFQKTWREKGHPAVNPFAPTKPKRRKRRAE